MTKIRLSKLPTRAPKGLDKNDVKDKREELTYEIGQLAMKMHAEKKKSLLVVFQGMDSSGKDGVCLLYTSPSPRDQRGSRMPSSA